MMNSWLGILMKNFNVLPRDGKELITDFLGMPSVYSEQPTTATHYTIIHNMYGIHHVYIKYLHRTRIFYALCRRIWRTTLPESSVC